MLKDTEATRKSWDHRFTLKYSLVLKATELQLEATVINENEGPSSSSFSMTFCFHTYINLPDVRRCHLEGFQGQDRSLVSPVLVRPLTDDAQ